MKALDQERVIAGETVTRRRGRSGARGTITEATVEEAAYEAHRLAATVMPADVRAAFRRMHAAEANELPRMVMGHIIENLEVAEADQRPICADVGVSRLYVVVGNEARIEGGFVAFERAVRRATVRVTRDLALRSNRCHPLNRGNPGTNVGLFAPNIEYRFEPDADWTRCTRAARSAATSACWLTATASAASRRACSMPSPSSAAAA